MSAELVPSAKPRPSDVLRVEARTLEAQATTLRNLADWMDEEASTRADGGEMLTPEDAAAELGISRQTVMAHIKNETLAAEQYGPKLYRISRADLAAYRRRHRVRS